MYIITFEVEAVIMLYKVEDILNIITPIANIQPVKKIIISQIRV
jgi:hypothetical protein